MSASGPSGPLVYVPVLWSKMTIFIEINNGQPIPLMWYTFILLFLVY